MLWALESEFVRELVLRVSLQELQSADSPLEDSVLAGFGDQDLWTFHEPHVLHLEFSVV